jgi:hypothetical protein
MGDQSWALKSEIGSLEYWIALEIIMAKSGWLRAFGRKGNLAGRLGEICKLDWRGP